MKKYQSNLTMTAGSVLLASVALSPMAASADANPFQTAELSSGYMQLAEKADGEGKCGEAKCGGDKSEPEGKCGEAKCGADKEKAKDGEGKCGEAKCGAEKESSKDEEGKCGEGKCGSN